MRANVHLLLRRARSQQTLLLAVVAVAVVGATLLGTFALLLSSSSHHLLATALDRTRATDREVNVTLTMSGSGNPDGALKGGADFLDDLLGDVPAERNTWLTSSMYAMQGTDDERDPYGYLASEPGLPSSSTLVSGALPSTGTDAEGRVQVAIPQVAADAYGWSVGTVVQARSGVTRKPLTFVVTGTFELTGPASSWGRDRLGGAQRDGAYPVLGSAGMLTTQAWGPFVVGDPAVLSDGTVELGVAEQLASPHLAGVATADLDRLRHGLDNVQQRLAAAVAADGASSIVGTRLSSTIDSATGSLLVTRVTLVVVALLLVTIAITVLMLAARMLADRRVGEQALMASRGASNGQILRLAALEAAAVAVIAGVASPFLAVLTYRVTALSPAMRRGGLDIAPGRPAILWVTCAASAILLAAVLVAPLLRRGSGGAASEARQERRGAAARSGADIALVALAGVALWQLRSYRTPVGNTSGALGGVDPVLVLAPALVLLAGAVLALRLMPLVAHVGERLAARSRSLVSPLAVWELGRRPARATAAVLLLTLAVGAGAFSSSFLSTWRSSQQDQTDLVVGTDIRATPGAATPLAAAAQITAAADGARVSAVTSRDVTIGVTSLVTGDAPVGVPATLLAVDTTHADDLLRGRIAPDWATRTAALRPGPAGKSVALPGSPRYLVVDLRSTVTTKSDGTVESALVVQDPAGGRTSVALPTLTTSEERRDVVVKLPATMPGLQLVGVVAHSRPMASDTPLPDGTAVSLSLADLRAVDGPADASRDGSEPLPALADLAPADVHAVSLAGTWNTDRSGADVSTEAGTLRVRGAMPAFQTFDSSPVDLTAVTFPPSADDAAGADAGALVTPDVLDLLDREVGDQLALDVSGTPVTVVIAGTVPYLPGYPQGRGVLVDEDALSRTLVASGSTEPLADEWWIGVPDAQAPAVAGALTRAGAASSVVRATERQDAIDGPLRVGVQAAVWIIVAAALALAVSGLAMSAAVTVRARRLEFARLQALGAPRSDLVRSVLVEHVILGVVGVAVGVGLGALLAHVVAPLITTSAAGGTPVPGVQVHWVWVEELIGVGVLVGLVALVVALTTNVLLKRASGQLLRLGDER